MTLNELAIVVIPLIAGAIGYYIKRTQTQTDNALKNHSERIDDVEKTIVDSNKHACDRILKIESELPHIKIDQNELDERLERYSKQWAANQTTIMEKLNQVTMSDKLITDLKTKIEDLTKNLTDFQMKNLEEVFRLKQVEEKLKGEK